MNTKITPPYDKEYTSPMIDIFPVSAELGFATSGLNTWNDGTLNRDGNENIYDWSNY